MDQWTRRAASANLPRMDIIWFLLTGVVVYLVADGVVRYIERRRGEAMTNRSLVFFAIFLPTILLAFEFIERVLGPG